MCKGPEIYQKDEEGGWGREMRRGTRKGKSLGEWTCCSPGVLSSIEGFKQRLT